MGIEIKRTHGVLGSNVSAIDESVVVVIVNYRTPELAQACLQALRQDKSLFKDLRVVLVDGGSGDGSAQQLAGYVERIEFQGWVQFLPLETNGGFGWANNQAIQRLTLANRLPAYIHLLNPDAEIEAGAIASLAQYLNVHTGTGAVGSQLLGADGAALGSAFVFPSIKTEFARAARTKVLERFLRIRPISMVAQQAMEVDWVTGASVMFRVAALREVGLFDEGFFLYHEEVELMWRLQRAGWTVAAEPCSRVRHVGGAATGVTDPVADTEIQSRLPRFLYRSRTRFFALTRGRAYAALAFTAWLGGHVIWKVRQALGLAKKRSSPHELADHLVAAFPRKYDAIAAHPMLEAQPSVAPAWLCNRWI